MDRYGMAFLAPPYQVKRVIYQIYHPPYCLLLPIIITNLVIMMMMKTKMISAVDDKNACDDVEGWPQRCESHGSGWVGGLV